MKKIVAVLSIVLLVAAAVYAGFAFLGKKKINTADVNPVVEKAEMLPRVLFLTTGTSEGNGEISEGVSVAIQELTKKGAYVWLGTREYLLQPSLLDDFNVLIAPTSFNYHDGDRKYSLTFLDDIEMRNISDWVREGGILVTEENIGRNTPEQIDRLTIGGEINPGNWLLSDVLGIKMREMDLLGFIMEDKGSGIWDGMIKDTVKEDEWALIATEVTSGNLEVMAEWRKGDEVFPAVFRNKWGEGYAYMLTSTYMLHPSNDGGVSGVEQIEKFYDKVISTLPGQTSPMFSLSPWPEGYSNAAVLSFNSGAETEKLKALLEFLDAEKIAATFVIDSVSTEEHISLISKNPLNEMISGLSRRKDFTGSQLSENARAFIEIEQATGLKFRGVRFPFRSSNFAGLIYASDNGYLFDTSVGIDHLSGYSGCVFPYNIPLARDSFYKSTEMLELCQVLKSDQEFFQIPDSVQDYTEELQREQSLLYSKYLRDFFQFVVMRNGGLMVCSADPEHVAYSELTLQSLRDLTTELLKNNTWITTASEVALYRRKLDGLIITSEISRSSVSLRIHMEDKSMMIEGLTIKLQQKPKDLSATCNIRTKEVNAQTSVIADVKDGDALEFSY